ncbi:MAG: HAMP domain-containing histidine kinase [Myxococcales bacterium]|nr:HAMP domain-containing histidine kinase [Myxococcales bacterium]
MSLRVRYVLATSAITLVTLGGAFVAVSVSVNASQQEQLDLTLAREAIEEAAEAASLGGDELAISDRPGPAANDVGPLTKYGAIYDRAGELLAHTPSWQGRPPALAELPPPGAPAFDLWAGDEHLRATHVELPAHPGTSLLLAAPRTDLDGDKRFLARAMAAVFGLALLWTVLVAAAVVRRLTRGHRLIAAVARRVADGDLDARIALAAGDAEVLQLARDIDAMIDRLGLLIGSQQRFIANAAHELRSPLTALYGELSLALRRPRSEVEYERVIRTALESSQRLRRLTEDLLAAVQIGETGAPPVATAVAQICQEAADLVAYEAEGRGVAVVREGPALAVLGRPDDLVRLLRNLLENAVRHAPPATRVSVRWRVDGEQVRLSVRDAGPGVDAADREKIFEPFHRGPQERGGSGAGLGLTIAREIARAHGGEVQLADGGDGACFVLTLPAAR